MAAKDDKVVEDISKVMKNPQGGKAFAQRLQVQESDLDRIGQTYMQGNKEATQDQVDKYKKKFMLYDLDHSGDINLEELRLMMEKLGQPKTHVELKKMIAQVDKSGSGTIDYMEFLEMMLGKSDNSILKKILMFEEMGKEKEKPTGLPPKKSISDLP
eukprot:TRINITY_DN21925_c0_g1_i1.p1 TRINITY_DN21925_c0_g1~~TRINITY_DN21925_c0_g1_i1.p1  ORF type:complete len:157 (+),score=54.11 TRINITY_DN21925_c0_g1_i1:18-488(+)